MEKVLELIRDVPNFPREGIIFKDITPVLKSPWAFQRVVASFVDRYQNKKVDAVVGIEARGFILGAAVANALEVGFVPIRKKGKLPHKTLAKEYLLEYGTDSVEIHSDALHSGERVVLIDDVLATGGTALASAQLIQSLTADLVEIAFLLELSFLSGRDKLGGYPIFSSIRI